MIDSFSGPYEFLSNFYPCEVEYQGSYYPSVEHAYQAAKTINSHERELIRTAETPGRAKRLGNKITLRADWETIKCQVMLDLLTQKFNYADLREKLLDTGNKQLIEGNNWHDYFWGVCNGKGQNMLGELLMKIRENI